MVITDLEDLDLFSYLFNPWILRIFPSTIYSAATTYTLEDIL